MTTQYILVPPESKDVDSPISIELGRQTYYYRSKKTYNDEKGYHATIGDITINGVADDELVYFAIQWSGTWKNTLNFFFDVDRESDFADGGYYANFKYPYYQPGGNLIQSYTNANSSVFGNKYAYVSNNGGSNDSGVMDVETWQKGPWFGDKPAGDVTWTGIPITTVTGSGSGAIATVTVSGIRSGFSFTLTTNGSGYAVGDVVKFKGSDIPGGNDARNTYLFQVKTVNAGVIQTIENVTVEPYKSEASLWICWPYSATDKYDSFMRGPYNNNGDGGWQFNTNGILKATTKHFIGWYGPAKYIKEMVKTIKCYQIYDELDTDYFSDLRPLSVEFCVALRTETYDTVYSDVAYVKDEYYGLDKDTSTDWVYDNAKVLDSRLQISDKGLVKQLTYPYVSQIDLTYNEETQQGVVETKTDIGFIYQGRTVRYPINATGTTIPVESAPVTGSGLLSGGALTLKSTEDYSQNPAMCALDYVTNIRYGLGGSGINFDKFSLDAYYSALRCDEQVATGEKDDGGTGAVASAALNGTAIQTVTIVHGGSGYINPKIAVGSTAGSGAVVVPIVVNGVITGATVQQGGSNYTADDMFVVVYDDIPKGTGNPIYMGRYTLNTVIDNQQSKLETLNNILSSCDARYFWHNGYIRLYQDAPKTTSAIVNQTTATKFTYSGSDSKTALNTVYVKFNNRRKLFSQDTSFAEDQSELKAGRPIVSRSVTAFGITNPGQAARSGRLMIENEKDSDQLVTYTAGADHTFLVPGYIVLLSDSTNEDDRKGGRVVSVSNTGVVQIDENFQFVGGKNYTMYITKKSTDGSGVVPEVYAFSVANPGTLTKSFTIGGAGSTTVGTYCAGLPYIIVENGTEPTYEIISIKEKDEFIYDVTVRKYRADKFALVDIGYYSTFQYAADFPNNYTEDSD